MAGLPAKPPKKRVVILGDARVQSQTQTLAFDMHAFGLNDIHDMIVEITQRDVGKEMAEGNDPTTIEVDGTKNTPLQQVNKKVVVLFSRGISRAALEQLRAALIMYINQSTSPISGRLSDPANWEFRLIRNGRSLSLGGQETILLQQRDAIILIPKLYYASSVNMRVAGGSKSMDYRPTETNRNGKYQKIAVAKRNQKLGFMAMTARHARGMSEFATFAVSVFNTKRFAVPGERRRYGTAFLRITPRRGNVRR